MDSLQVGGSGGSPEIKREPWWKYPPKPGETEADLEWGFLVEYENGDIRFIEEVPAAQVAGLEKRKATLSALIGRREAHNGM